MRNLLLEGDPESAVVELWACRLASAVRGDDDERRSVLRAVGVDPDTGLGRLVEALAAAVPLDCSYRELVEWTVSGVVHGTKAGVAAHRRARSAMCTACERYLSQDWESDRPDRCGTLRGAARHYRLGQVPCDRCRWAVRDETRVQQAQRRARKVASPANVA